MSKLVFAYGYVAAVFPLSSQLQLQHDLVKVVLRFVNLPIACLIEYICNALKSSKFC
jgi:hypothetical protein